MKFDINGLIKTIKEKLPFGKEEEEEVEETQVEEEDEKTSDKAEDEEEEEEEDEEAAAKKKKGLYIKIAAGIVVAFMAIDEFSKDQESAPRAPTKKVKTIKKKSKKPKKAPKKKIAKKKKVEKPVKKVVKKVEPVIPKEPAKPIKREISSVPPTVEPKQEPADLALKVSDIIEEIGTPTKEELKGPATFVAPPDYTEVGRGLVYNCKGRHWACVDKNSYFACRDNLKWSKENTKTMDCFTKDVYRNESDCRIVQTHFVNTNEKTDFCK